MTATTSSLRSQQHDPRTASPLRRLARAGGSFMAAIGMRWNDFVESGQLGPDTERTASRHTGARI